MSAQMIFTHLLLLLLLLAANIAHPKRPSPAKTNLLAAKLQLPPAAAHHHFLQTATWPVLGQGGGLHVRFEGRRVCLCVKATMLFVPPCYALSCFFFQHTVRGASRAHLGAYGSGSFPQHTLVSGSAHPLIACQICYCSYWWDRTAEPSSQ